MICEAFCCIDFELLRIKGFLAFIKAFNQFGFVIFGEAEKLEMHIFFCSVNVVISEVYLM